MKRQSKEEAEKWYEKPDQWKYWDCEDDQIRKKEILSMLDTYETALDIGAGEGFITEDLPAKDIYAIEWSENAKARLHDKIKIHNIPDKCDLVVSCGTLYEQYNHEEMADLIKKHASKYVLIAGIKDWLIPYTFGKIIAEKTFKYRQYEQKVTLYLVA